MLVGDEPGVVAVADVGGDRLHRPGAVEGDDRDQILDRLGAELGDHVAHARGLELEDADALPLGEHREGVGIVERDAVRAKAGTAFGGLLLGIADDRQRAQAEEVHLEQPELLKRRHRELGDRHRLLRLVERHVAVHRVAGDDDARRVGRGVAGHPLDLARHVEQLCDLGVALAHLLEVRRDRKRPVERHLQLVRHELGDRVHLLVGDAEHPPHVADGRARGHRPEGDDLRDMVRAVLAHDVVDDLLPPLVTEIDVEVGHADPLGVQKPLEEQVVADGIDAGDADAVGGEASRARTAPRPAPAMPNRFA